MKKYLGKNSFFIFGLFIVVLFPVFIPGCGGVTPTGPVINSFTASSTAITEGENVTLSWQVTDATSVSINQGVGSVALSGSTSVSPASTITYSLTATNSAGTSNATITITVESEMEEVIDFLIADILPGIPEIQSGAPYQCLKLDTSLPSGTIIKEDTLFDMKASVSLTLEEELYFFYLDLAPSSLYEHPVKYILVDAEGNHEEYDAKWWPKINNQVPDIITKEFPEPEDIVASNIALKKPIGTIPVYIIDFISQFKEGFIVVQGLMPSESCFNCCNDTYLNAIHFFDAYKNDFSRMEGLVQSDATQVLDAIDAMAEEDRGIITIFIIAHGGVNSVRLGGERFYASEFRNKMAEYPDIEFNFILGSCHSGSFIDDLSTLSNVNVVETACASDESAWCDYDEYGSYNDVNPSDVGSEWTSSLIRAMELIVNNSDRMGTVQTMASNYGVPVTSMLICEAGFGAVGAQPGLGLTTDYDLTHIIDWTTPSYYCVTETVY